MLLRFVYDAFVKRFARFESYDCDLPLRKFFLASWIVVDSVKKNLSIVSVFDWYFCVCCAFVSVTAWVLRRTCAYLPRPGAPGGAPPAISLPKEKTFFAKTFSRKRFRKTLALIILGTRAGWPPRRRIDVQAVGIFFLIGLDTGSSTLFWLDRDVQRRTRELFFFTYVHDIRRFSF